MGLRTLAAWGAIGWALERVPGMSRAREALSDALDTRLRTEAASVTVTEVLDASMVGLPLEVIPPATVQVGFLGPSGVTDAFATGSLSGTTKHYYQCPSGKKAYIYRIQCGVLDTTNNAGSPLHYGGVSWTPGTTGLQIAVVDSSDTLVRYVYRDIPANFAFQLMFPNFSANYSNSSNVVSAGEVFTSPIVLTAGQRLRAHMQTAVTGLSANTVNIAYVEVDA